MCLKIVQQDWLLPQSLVHVWNSCHAMVNCCLGDGYLKSWLLYVMLFLENVKLIICSIKIVTFANINSWKWNICWSHVIQVNFTTVFKVFDGELLTDACSWKKQFFSIVNFKIIIKFTTLHQIPSMDHCYFLII